MFAKRSEHTVSYNAPIESALISVQNTNSTHLTDVRNMSTSIFPSPTLTGHSVKLSSSQKSYNKNPLLYNSHNNAREKDSVIVLHRGFATSTPKSLK